MKPRVAQSQTLLKHALEPEPKSQAELAAKMLDDYQVKLARETVQGHLMAIPLYVWPEGTKPEKGQDWEAFKATYADTRQQSLAKHLELLWTANVSKYIQAWCEGRIVFEVVFAYDAASNLRYPAELIDLPVRMTTMRLNPNGEYDGVTLEDGDRKEILTAANSWWLPYNPTPVCPYGTSAFVKAPYKVWKQRVELIKLIEVFVRRKVLQGPVVECPTEPIQENGQAVDPIEAMSRAWDESLSGGMLCFPKDGNRESPYKILQEFKVHDAGGLMSDLEALDQDQIQAFGIPPKTVMEGEGVGSYAQTAVHMQTLYALMEGIFTQFQESFQKSVVNPACARNGVQRLMATHKSLLTPREVETGNITKQGAAA